MTQSQRTPADYQAQLDEKRDRLTQLFADFNPPALEVHASPAEHYRMRAEFRIWHEGDDLFHCMYAQATKEIIRVDSFPTASLLINRLMPVLLAGLRPHPVLRRKLFQIDYLSTQSGQLCVSLLYHRKLEAEWQQAAEALQADLRAKGFELQLIGRAHKQKICLGDDFVIERLTVQGRELVYKQVENSFTQPNAAINEQMLGWTLDEGGEIYYLIWAFLLVAMLTTHNLLDSREGRAIRALKGGRVMAEAMGVDTSRSRMVIFVIAALLACASGWLYAHMQRFVNPTPFGLHIAVHQPARQVDPHQQHRDNQHRQGCPSWHHRHARVYDLR